MVKIIIRSFINFVRLEKTYRNGDRLSKNDKKLKLPYLHKNS